MAKFRCPRCGAVVEGLHDRCPRCKVLFKYRKEDIDLLTPYKSQGPEVPERIEERKVEEPLPVQEAAPVQEPAPVVEEVKSEPAPVVEKPAPDYSKNKKARTAATVFGVVGLVMNLFISTLLGLIFGIVALAQAKKAKPIKATAGKILGIVDLVLGILGILWTLFIMFLVFLALVGAGIYVALNWDAIAQSLGMIALL